MVTDEMLSKTLLEHDPGFLSAPPGLGHLAPLMSSKDMGWQTPDHLLDLVRQVAVDGTIALDPCTTPDNPCRATRFFTPEDDAFTHNWAGPGLAYANPEYGRALARWTAKFVAEADRRELIVLVPARPDTRWFQDHLTTADAICFWRGRLKFKGAAASAPFPSAIAYWGPSVDRFRTVFGPKGWIPGFHKE